MGESVAALAGEDGYGQLLQRLVGSDGECQSAVNAGSQSFFAAASSPPGCDFWENNKPSEHKLVS